MGDHNPAYQDAEWAANSARGHLIAPPAMMYSWGQHGFQAALKRPRDAQSDLVALFNEYGFTGTLGTNVRQEYVKEVALGDTVHMEMIIDEITERKDTSRGVGYFFETLATFTNNAGEEVGTQRFRVLKFLPSAQPEATATSEEKLDVPPASPPPAATTTSWWWDACDEGKVLIQRCKNCQTLRHPPRPMCGECQSEEWDSHRVHPGGNGLSASPNSTTRVFPATSTR